MGQRLNIEIWFNDECLANAYYHWSGYTTPAAWLAREAIQEYTRLSEEFNIFEDISPLEVAVKMLQKTGAGLNEYERARVVDRHEFKDIVFNDCKNRNDGLLAVTKEGIEETRRYEEERVRLILDSEEMDFQVVSLYSKEEVLNNEDEIYMPDEELNFDLSRIPFDDVSDFISFVENTDGAVQDDWVFYWIQ